MARLRTPRAAALAAALAACAGSAPPGADGGTDPPPDGGGGTVPAGWVRVARASAGALDVELLSDRTLGTGLAALAVRVTAGGAAAGEAAVALSASRRAATGVDRTAPVLAAPALAQDGTWRLEAVLPDAAGAADGWTAAVAVARPGEPDAVAELPALAVAERGLAVPFGGGAMLLAVRFDGALQVGQNPVTVALHETADGGATWTPIADAAFAVDPWMPSMGHGAEGSVPPVPDGAPGRYAGEVSLSMPGDWEIAFTVSRAGVELGRPAVAVWF